MKHLINVLLALLTVLMLLAGLIVFSAPAYTPEYTAVRVEDQPSGGLLFE